MDKCDIIGGILSLGFNKFAESQGLKPLPAGAGLAFDLSPGFLFKQEVKGLCQPGTGSLLTLDLTKLSLFAQAYLIDRMESIASEQQDKSLRIPGKRFESPSVPLGLIGLDGKGSAVIWYDPEKQGVDKLNGVLLKLTFNFK
ncbi:hypothetical protein V5E97_25720 [Singulisphaera sp. Ch08]|uniref:Uncharacterized protein n=1 Tax=Singulisphaera sp. Ch08 TaxID=3120278 RepID=A0AAU7C915_9BACT